MRNNKISKRKVRQPRRRRPRNNNRTQSVTLASYIRATYQGFKALTYIIHSIASTTSPTYVSIGLVANALMSILQIPTSGSFVFIKYNGKVLAIPAYTNADRRRRNIKIKSVKVVAPYSSGIYVTQMELKSVLGTSEVPYTGTASDSTRRTRSFKESQGTVSAPASVFNRFSPIEFNAGDNGGVALLGDAIPLWASNIGPSGSTAQIADVSYEVTAAYKASDSVDAQAAPTVTDLVHDADHLDLHHAMMAREFLRKPWVTHAIQHVVDVSDDVKVYQTYDEADKEVHRLTAIISERGEMAQFSQRY